MPLLTLLMYSNVLVGLPTLIDQLLISNARKLQTVNEHGGEKLYRDVLALQQNLKNLGDIPLHANLDRSKLYFGLLKGTSPEVSLVFQQIHSSIKAERCETDSFQHAGQAAADTAFLSIRSTNIIGLVLWRRSKWHTC